MIKTLMNKIREFITWGITTLPLKEISSRDLQKEGCSKEGRNGYDKRLHGKIDDQDKWDDTGKALWNLDILVSNYYQL
jgi:hypothetical protein